MRKTLPFNETRLGLDNVGPGEHWGTSQKGGEDVPQTQSAELASLSDRCF